MKICLASNNQHKIQELQSLLPKKMTLCSLSDLGVEDIPETGRTLEANSLLKAKHVHDRFNLSSIADDSGLLVTSLDDEPGVFSARYAGAAKDDEANIDLLLKNLNDKTDRSARFETVITYINEKGTATQFSGRITGKILAHRTGTGGFGYDPVFQPDGYAQSFAELGAEVKNTISHRAIAVKKLVTFLQEQNG